MQLQFCLLDSFLHSVILIGESLVFYILLLLFLNRYSKSKGLNNVMNRYA